MILSVLFWPVIACGDGAQTAAGGAAVGETIHEERRGVDSAATTDEINPRLLRRFREVDGRGTAERRDPNQVTLGRFLFFDKRLSRGQTMSCNSCHALDKYGIDGRPVSSGFAGQLGTRNAPTVFNAASHFAQFWDGRSESVEEQALFPLLNVGEMAMPSEASVVAVLESIPEYVDMFAKAFPGSTPAVSFRHLGEALGAFERGLVTRSRWDDFIAGNTAALSLEEKRGLRVFLDSGCMVCHTGPQVGGTMFQRTGAVIPWPNQKDQGRAQITKVPGDRMMFKVPSLKNIEKTGPYFHDGSTSELSQAVRLMARHQLGLELAEDEVKAILAWMHSMTGRIDPAYVAAPQLPKGPGKGHATLAN